MNYLIDTNILVVFIRDDDITYKLEEDIKLLTDDNTLLISVVSIGEIKSIALRNNWGVKKQNKIISILNDFLISDINVEDIIDRYAEIDAFSQNKLKGKDSGLSSRNMGKNDLWIAAAASIYNFELVTTDKDFLHLDGEYLDLRLIDLDQYKV